LGTWRSCTITPSLSTDCLYQQNPHALQIRNYTTAVAKQRLRKQACFHGNNYTATEERCFLRGPCRDIISRAS
jgi:hypothetical protein